MTEKSFAAVYVERDPPVLVIDDGRPVRLPLDEETVAFLLAALAKVARRCAANE